MKNIDHFLKEYFYRLSDENLKVLHSRLHFRYQGDIPEVLNFVGNNKDLDRWLGGASGYFDFYGMVDTMHEAVNREYQKRFDIHR
jgi:hypothetical protein